MNRIEGKGKPTRTTKGAVGDEYVDTDTRLRYKCTFAFCDSISNEFVYEWNQMRGNRINICPQVFNVSSKPYKTRKACLQ